VKGRKDNKTRKGMWEKRRIRVLGTKGKRGEGTVPTRASNGGKDEGEGRTRNKKQKNPQQKENHKHKKKNTKGPQQNNKKNRKNNTTGGG